MGKGTSPPSGGHGRNGGGVTRAIREPFDAIVVGAGISGLTAAYLLAKAGKRTLVLEREPQIGGLLAVIRRGGFEIERLYHHLFSHDSAVFRLLTNLGLMEEVYWGDARSGFYHGSRWYDVSKPLDLLRFKPLSLFERIRLGLALFQSRHEKNPEHLDGVSVRRWLGLKSGSRLEAVFDSLTRGKFGLDSGEVSAAFLCGRFGARTRTRARDNSSERFGYLGGGLRLLVERIAERVEDAGSAIVTGCRVERISRAGDGFRVAAEGLGEVEARHLVSTIPPAELALVADFLAPEQRESMRAVDYIGVACLCCALDRPLSPYYWGTIGDPRLPFVVVVEHTNFYRGEEYGGRHIVYAARYEQLDDASPQRLARIEAEMLEGLRSIAPQPPEVEWSEMSYFSQATPIYRVGFGERVSSFPDIDGLVMTGAPFTYPDSRNINTMVESATAAVDSIIG